METYSNIGERELAALCSKMDRSALKELYTRYAARVLALCFRYTNDRMASEDIMHDTMIKVFGAIGRFRYQGDGSLYAWIRRIAVNLVIDRLRKRNSSDLSALREEELLIEETSQDIPIPVVLGIISTLPDTQRLVLNLYCIDGFSHKEIADMLGIKPKTSSSLLSKARRTLNERIEKYSNTRIKR